VVPGTEPVKVPCDRPMKGFETTPVKVLGLLIPDHSPQQFVNMWQWGTARNKLNKFWDFMGFCIEFGPIFPTV